MQRNTRHMADHGFQAQTPQQRKANMAYARAQEQKMGKPQSQVKKDKPQKPPISRMWVCKCSIAANEMPWWLTIC
jgi:hypothetical protein